MEEVRYLGHVMTADCRDDTDIGKQFRRKNVVGNILVRKFSFSPTEAKIQLFKSYFYPIYGCALWRHYYQNLIRKLTVSLHSNDLLNNCTPPACGPITLLKIKVGKIW